MTASVREAASPEDKLLSLEIYNAVVPREAVKPHEVEAWNAAAEKAVEYIASVEGEDVGSAACAINTQRPLAAFTLVTVLPHARNRGAGSALYAACLAFARANGRELLETRVDVGDDASLEFAQRRDFVEHQREDWLELDVSTAPPRDKPPADVEIVTLAQRPDAAPGAYDVACDAFPDIPGEEDWTPPPRDRWVESFRTAYAPELSFLALADDEVVGYAQLRARKTFAVHGMTAVKRAWRKRGVARALKSAQIDWAARNGVQHLRTTNEQRNAPMRNLNLRLGYVPKPGRITLRGPLLAALVAAAFLATTALAAARPDPKQFLAWNAAHRTVDLTLLAGLGSSNNGFNFDGYGRGELRVSIPRGWRVTVHCVNRGSLRHSCAVVANSVAATAAFRGAATPHPFDGLSPGAKATFTFVASRAGVYRIACLVAGHEQARMWDVLTVTAGGRPSIKAIAGP
ncbi:MAG: GNAT family N-acetyltransferase [Gaiellaceae bacterium]